MGGGFPHTIQLSRHQQGGLRIQLSPHCAPAVSARPHQFRAQSHKTATTSEANGTSRLSLEAGGKGAGGWGSPATATGGAHGPHGGEGVAGKPGADTPCEERCQDSWVATWRAPEAPGQATVPAGPWPPSSAPQSDETPRGVMGLLQRPREATGLSRSDLKNSGCALV